MFLPLRNRLSSNRLKGKKQETSLPYRINTKGGCTRNECPPLYHIIHNALKHPAHPLNPCSQDIYLLFRIIQPERSAHRPFNTQMDH